MSETGVSTSEAGGHVSSPSLDLNVEEQLKRQLEWYFSKENLTNDNYLNSQMNSSKFVPIDVISKFPKVLRLTSNRDVLVKVMRTCKNLVCDEAGTMVRPAKYERRTLILRDIPKDIPESDIKGIFKDEKCGKVVHVRPDIDNTWFVDFESEEDCLSTFNYLNISNKTFRGEPLRCRVKSEPLRYHGSAGTGGEIPAKYRNGPPANFLWGYSYYPAAATNWQGDGSVNKNSADQPVEAAYGSVLVGAAAVAVDDASSKKAPKGRKGEAPVAGSRGGGGGGGRGGKKGGPQGGGGGGGRKNPRAYEAKAPVDVPSGPEHFPALPTAAPQKKVNGYGKQFQKYSREEMAGVVAEMNKKGAIAKLPTLPTSAECVVLRSSPLLSCQLLEPFPVMYPASPSPVLAAQPHHSSDVIPFLNLGLSGFDLDSAMEASVAAATAAKPAAAAAASGPKPAPADDHRRRRGSARVGSASAGDKKHAHHKEAAAAPTPAPAAHAAAAPAQQHQSPQQSKKGGRGGQRKDSVKAAAPAPEQAAKSAKSSAAAPSPKHASVPAPVAVPAPAPSAKPNTPSPTAAPERKTMAELVRAAELAAKNAPPKPPSPPVVSPTPASAPATNETNEKKGSRKGQKKNNRGHKNGPKNRENNKHEDRPPRENNKHEDRPPRENNKHEDRPARDHHNNNNHNDKKSSNPTATPSAATAAAVTPLVQPPSDPSKLSFAQMARRAAANNGDKPQSPPAAEPSKAEPKKK